MASEVLPHVKFALVSAEGADKQGVMQTFFQTLAAGTVPIVIGAADIKVAAYTLPLTLTVFGPSRLPILAHTTIH